MLHACMRRIRCQLLGGVHFVSSSEDRSRMVGKPYLTGLRKGCPSSGDDSPPSQCLQYFRLPFVYRSG
jgi:hypothetical protein